MYSSTSSFSLSASAASAADPLNQPQTLKRPLISAASDSPLSLNQRQHHTHQHVSPSASASVSAPVPGLTAFPVPSGPSFSSFSSQFSVSTFGSILSVSPLKSAPNALLACFDMDFTLIRPASGARFARSAEDWKWLDEQIPARLRSLHSTGYSLLVFSNQNGVSSGRVSRLSLVSKAAALASSLAVPFFAFFSCSDDFNRKPNSGMFDFYSKYFNSQLPADKERSFYVGDAAGRLAGWDGKASTKKDFSCSDRLFARGLGLKFFTPEEYFFNSPVCQKFSCGEKPESKQQLSIDNLFKKARTSSEAEAEANSEAANNVNAKANVSVSAGAGVESGTVAVTSPAAESKSEFDDISSSEFVPSSVGRELLLLIGSPASGKTSFARRHLEPLGYHRISQDELKNRDRCLKALRVALESGLSAVVDNTNPAAETRKLYIDIANEFRVPVRLIWFDLDEKTAIKLNSLRSAVDSNRPAVPRIAFASFKKNFQIPKLVEGVRQILRVKFKPEFNSENEKAIFQKLSS